MRTGFTLSLASALLALAVTVTVVMADDNDEQRRGNNAPEVPFALLYPATAMVGYGLYRFRKQ